MFAWNIELTNFIRFNSSNPSVTKTVKIQGVNPQYMFDIENNYKSLINTSPLISQIHEQHLNHLLHWYFTCTVWNIQ